MGMSGDFAQAIRAGATMVRVGTAIFGARSAIQHAVQKENNLKGDTRS